MNIQLNDLMHPQIQDTCIKLFEDGHPKHAAFEAMKQVEIALREKGLAPHDKFGDKLINWVLGTENLRLVVPLGEELQEKAKLLFRGAFAYYRNYTAHDGSKIDKKVSIRIMILASELLDLINASRRSLDSLGGVKGLIKSGVFKNEQEIIAFLELLNKIIVHVEAGEISEYLGEGGFSSNQYELALELGICEYIGEYIAEPMSQDELSSEKAITPIGGTRLTDLGQNLLENLRNKKGNE